MMKKAKIALFLTFILTIQLLPSAAYAANDASGTLNYDDAVPEAILAGMTAEEKVAQMIMPAFRWYPDENGEKQNVTELPADVAAILEKHGFAGVTLFAQNTGDTAKAVRLIDDMQKANAAEGRTQLLIAIDQEGGRVTRLGHGTQMPGNMALGAANDAALTATAASIIGRELMSMGVNFNFAPVLDVNSNPANPVIGTRSFSDDPAIVANQGVSYMRALQATGAISTLKHFPGHGDTATDSHTGLPLVDKSYAELKSCELAPFRAAIDAGADAVMTAHIQYPQIETGKYTSKLTGEQINLPATLSKTILTDILRGGMGFDGVVITDAMEMDAIAMHFDRYDAAKLAIEAGVDILLMPVDTSTPEGLADLDVYIQKLAQMVKNGEISEKQVDDAVLRVLRLKAAHGLIAPYVSIDKDASRIVGSAAHHEAEWEITKKTITLVKNDDNTLPLTKENQKIAVLTAYDNEVLSMEYAIGRLRDEGKLAKGTEITVRSIQKKTAEEAIACTAGAEHVVIITELGSAAGLKNDTAKTVDALIESVHKAGGDVTIMSCSLPYDVSRYQAADAIVVAWSARGMSEDPRITDGNVAQYGPSMPAALYLMLSPDETPMSVLPVNIPKLTDELTYSDEIL
ncbi:MAG: glycoside hydrolase family 3 C-terminal domain-containing protein, partial [Oscillospiraceae bacterium]|nr:glycoside hydrolase family 3 C-terminal domain-containing protein [Oscillospiraceae bacterium]